MRQVLIRSMREEDIPEVARIEQLSFPTPWSGASFLTELAKPASIALVAEAGDTVIGYICADQVLDEGHILTLAVRPEFRGMGIARSLVGRAAEGLKERLCRFLFLEVRASNRIAKRLYEGMGFRVVGRRKGYYVSPNEDAIIMALDLTS